MPPSASSNLPRRSAAAPVNAPFSWPNSSLSISSVGMAAQFTLTNGPRGERALAMDVRRQQLLAGSRFARQQHADVGSRHLRRLLHGAAGTPALDPIIRGASPDQLAEALVLALQVRPLERVLDDEQHAVARERLLEEVERAAPRRLDGVGNRAVPGDHHGGAIAHPTAAPTRSRSMPLPSGSRTSSRYTSARRAASLRRERRRRFEHADAVALAFQDQAQRPADVRLVVDDDDVRVCAS